MPWKNGGGRTREIAVYLPGAGMDDFLWRVSVAEICEAGSFSLFPGIERQLLLLDGSGVVLELPEGCHRLLKPYQALRFAGEAPVRCAPLNGRCHALNVMTRRGGAVAELKVSYGAHLIADTGILRMFFVARGAYRCGGKDGMLFELHQGDAVLIAGRELVFSGQGDPDAVLIEVEFRL
ncbi:MAG TPA: HutD family protein [Novimethylophilus sp.]|jgi:hypothetical protein|uniref:HutD/Ves family protein n=1 Tax=Novimethylophilus sp. TaxID=2137426 RepID=UPI002F3FE714